MQCLFTVEGLPAQLTHLDNYLNYELIFNQLFTMRSGALLSGVIKFITVVFNYLHVQYNNYGNRLITEVIYPS